MSKPQLHALQFKCTKPVAEVIAVRLEEVFWPAPLSVSLFEIDNGQLWEVEGLFEAAPQADTIAEFLNLNCPDRPVPTYELKKLADRDWVSQSLAGLKPVHAGRIFVHGAHDRDAVPASAISVEIDAGQAFGTGHHETTKSCLLALDSITKSQRPARILDVGTGSGVLAIAAAKLLKTRIIATDNDPIAIAVARQNAITNEVAPLFRGVVASGVRHGEVARPSGYGLILANILARPLAGLAGDICFCLAPGGHLVLSGILNTQARYVLAAYEARGLTLRQRLVAGDWTTLVLAR